MSKQKQKLFESFLRWCTPENKETCKNVFETIKWKSRRNIYSEKRTKFQGDAKKHGALW